MKKTQESSAALALAPAAAALPGLFQDTEKKVGLPSMVEKKDKVLVGHLACEEHMQETMKCHHPKSWRKELAVTVGIHHKPKVQITGRNAR